MLTDLKIETKSTTLVDQVENRLLNYFKEQDLRVGDAIPNELDLALALGVARSVLREALSRLKMLGMIQSRTRRGMVLCEPSIWTVMSKMVDPRILSENTLYDILGMRVALEIGICNDIFDNITDEDISALETIVNNGIIIDEIYYTSVSEFAFHSKLFEITRNVAIQQFQELIHPVMEFVKDKYHDMFEPINIERKANGEFITHADLLEIIKRRDRDAYKTAIEQHFAAYTLVNRERKKENTINANG
ncbi:MAG: FadR/GntR family transcriptional regulator [Marinifilaceae bacterium]